MRSRAILPGIMLAAALASIASAAGTATALFAEADLVPADVDTYLHVRDAATLRASSVGQPLTDSVRLIFGEGTFGDAWRELARATGAAEGEFFDELLGRRFTLVTRGPSWAIATEVSAVRIGTLINSLRPDRRLPRSGFEVAFLPSHDLLVASSGSRCILGPAADQQLFDDVLERFGGGAGMTAPLGEAPGIATGRTLGSGNAAVYVRHGELMGGWSVMVAARTATGELKLTHRARFEAPPFERPPTRLDWSALPLDSFAGSSIVAMIEPSDVGFGTTGAIIEQSLGTPIISPDLAAHVGDHRIMTMGEVDGRGSDRADVLMPTFAIAFPLDDAASGERMLDRHAARLLRAIGSAAPDPLLLMPPPDTDSGTPRSVDLSPLSRQFVGGEEATVVPPLSLNWVVAPGPGGVYGVIASHPDHLRDTMNALDRAVAAADGQSERLSGAGIVDGSRLARHLQSWKKHVGLIAVDGEGAAQLRDTLDLVAKLASGVERCGWRVRRPCANVMELDVVLRPALPRSGE